MRLSEAIGALACLPTYWPHAVIGVDGDPGCGCLRVHFLESVSMHVLDMAEETLRQFLPMEIYLRATCAMPRHGNTPPEQDTK